MVRPGLALMAPIWHRAVHAYVGRVVAAQSADSEFLRSPNWGQRARSIPASFRRFKARLFERKSPAADGAVFLSGRWGGVRVLVLPRLERVPGDEWKFSLYLEPWSEKAEQADPYRDEKKKT